MNNREKSEEQNLREMYLKESREEIERTIKAFVENHKTKIDPKWLASRWLESQFNEMKQITDLLELQQMSELICTAISRHADNRLGVETQKLTSAISSNINVRIQKLATEETTRDDIVNSLSSFVQNKAYWNPLTVGLKSQPDTIRKIDSYIQKYSEEMKKIENKFGEHDPGRSLAETNAFNKLLNNCILAIDDAFKPRGFFQGKRRQETGENYTQMKEALEFVKKNDYKKAMDLLSSLNAKTSTGIALQPKKNK